MWRVLAAAAVLRGAGGGAHLAHGVSHALPAPGVRGAVRVPAATGANGAAGWQRAHRRVQGDFGVLPNQGGHVPGK